MSRLRGSGSAPRAPADAVTPPVGRSDLALEGYHQLRELIVRGRLAPGARLVESEIAERLSLSRTPVRAALHRLQQEGIVIAEEGNRRSRLVVAPLTKDDAHELFHIVAELEGLAARFAAQLPEAPRHVLAAELRALNDSLARAAGADERDANLYFELDRDFHRRYVEAAAKPRILALHNQIKPQTDRYNRVYTSALFDRILTSVEEHRAIIAGIEQGDPDAAQTAVQHNFRGAAERLKKVIAAVGERGSW